ncbi:MAG: cupin domain-containing protein [Thermomicrobiales bacterium]|nr:cupin domain-containing protein [Thermomicrobiales bacterium]
MSELYGGMVMASDVQPGVQWVKRSDVHPMATAPGVEMRPMFGEGFLTCWVKLDPGAGVPEHSHVHEQIGVVTAGAIEVTVAGETRSLGVGEAYLVAPHAPHAASAGPGGCELVETFVPVREDFRALWEGSKPA